jgi:CheY-like chemotaxis protein
MDIKMPVMDGIEASRILRQKFPDIPIIAQTALAMENEKQMLREEGFHDILTKPITFANLQKIIEKFLP